MLTLEWLSSGERDFTCRACGARVTGPLVVEFDAPNGDRLSAARCPACNSLDILDSWRDFAPDDAAVDDYVQVGAGIALVASRLWAAQQDHPLTSLEVGCNFGFGVDFARRRLGWSALGIEPSAAASRGRRELGIDIRHEMLTVDTRMEGRYDLVIASEVIEHVTDPVGFLEAMRAHLSEGGSILLTTPNALSVRPQADPTDALSALSPGHHVFLCSPQGMERLLTRAGFPVHEIGESGDTLVVRAASADRLPPAFETPMPDAEVTGYLRDLVGRAQVPSALRLGAALRVLRESVARSEWPEAREAASVVKEEFRARYRIDLRRPRRAVARLDRVGAGLRPLVGAAYALAVLEEHDDRPRSSSEVIGLYSLSIEAARRVARENVLFDRDLSDIWQAAADRRVKAAARSGARPAASFVEDLVPPGLFTDESERRDARRSRLLMDLVGVGLGPTRIARSIAETALAAAERASASEHLGRAADGRDGLYAVSVVRRESGDPGGARAALQACIRACQAAPGDEAGDLNRLANADLELLTG